MSNMSHLADDSSADRREAKARRASYENLPRPDVASVALAEEYLRTLWPDGGPGNIVITVPEKNSSGRTSWYSFPFDVSDLSGAAAKACALSAAGKSVYSNMALRDKAITSGRGKAKDAMAIASLYADLDYFGPGHAETALPPDVETALEVLAELPIPPTMVVHSGGGLQVHYGTEKPLTCSTPDERKELRQLVDRFQAALRARLEARGCKLDSTSDLARTLRVPGTMNRKNGGEVPVTILSNDGPRYTRDELEAAFPPPPPKPPRGDGKTYEAGANAEWGQLILQRQCEEVAAETHDRHRKLFSSSCRMGELTLGGHLSEDEVVDALVPAGLIAMPEEDDAELERQVRNGIAMGIEDWGDEPPRGPEVKEPATRDTVAACAVRRGFTLIEDETAATGFVWREPKPRTQELTPIKRSEFEALLLAQEREDALDKYTLGVADVLRRRPPGWLIKGFLQEEALAQMVGPFSGGKSLLTLKWCTDLVRAGRRVLYCAAEGMGGFSGRLRAAMETYGVTLDDLFGLRFYPGSVNLADAEEATAMLAWVTLTGPWDLIVIDTLARAIPGADENASKDMGIAIRHAERMKQGKGSILLVHHAGWTAEHSRGSTALPAAQDNIIHCFPSGSSDGKKGRPLVIKVESEKLKDGKKGLPEFYGLVEHQLGTHADGEPWTSVALERTDPVKSDEDDGDPDRNKLLALLEKDGGQGRTQLAERLGWGVTKTYNELRAARKEGQVHDVKDKRSVTWVKGPAPKTPAAKRHLAVVEDTAATNGAKSPGKPSPKRRKPSQPRNTTPTTPKGS